MGIKVSLALHACQDRGGVGCNGMLQETPIQTSCSGSLGNPGRLGDWGGLGAEVEGTNGGG